MTVISASIHPSIHRYHTIAYFLFWIDRIEQCITDRNLTQSEYRYAMMKNRVSIDRHGIIRSNSGCRLVVTLLVIVCLDVLGALSSANDRTTVDKGNVRLPGLSTRFNKFAEYCLYSQQIIARDLSRVDGRSKVLLHPWERFQDVDRREHLEGYGVTGVIEDGDVVEKGAVSVTVVRGQLTAERAASISARQHRSSNSSSDEGSAAQAGRTYCAAALSIVLHSRSPLVPTFRADVRYFEVEGEEGWFGGELL